MEWTCVLVKYVWVGDFWMKKRIQLFEKNWKRSRMRWISSCPVKALLLLLSPPLWKTGSLVNQVSDDTREWVWMSQWWLRRRLGEQDKCVLVVEDDRMNNIKCKESISWTHFFMNGSQTSISSNPRCNGRVKIINIWSWFSCRCVTAPPLLHTLTR